MTGPTRAGPASEAVFGHHGATWDHLHKATALWEHHYSSFILLSHSRSTSHLRASREMASSHKVQARSRLFWLQTVSQILTRVRWVPILIYHTDLSGVTAHLHPHDKGDTSPSVFIFKCKADIYFPYTFGIISYCTRLLFKPHLSLRGADQPETKVPKIVRKSSIRLALHHHHQTDSNEVQTLQTDELMKEKPIQG